MSVSTLVGDTICNMAYVRCMQAKLTLKVAGGAECRGRHDDLQLADQVLYGLIAGALTSSPGVHGDWDRAAAPVSEAQELYEEGRRGKVPTGSRFCLSRQSRSRFPTAHSAKGKRKSMHAAPPPPRL